MIQGQTILNIKDNSGVLQVRCIQVQNKAYRNFGKIGATFIGVVLIIKRKIKKQSSFKRGDLISGIVIATKKENQTAVFSGIYFKTINQNFGVLISKPKKVETKLVPLISRVDGFLPTSFKSSGFIAFETLFKQVI